MNQPQSPQLQALPQAYLNGHFVPASEAVLPVYDGGFLQGTTVAEQLRTFGGQLFKLDEHLERLFRSLAIVGVDPGIALPELAKAGRELAAHNHRLLADGDDLGLTIFVTPGPYLPMAPAAEKRATVCMHTFPLAFDLWAAKYDDGERLATTDVAQVPAHCWPPELKCRSRMHYFLADRQARALHDGARALMLDSDGFVTEATTANVVIYHRQRGLVTPPVEKVLPGISLAALEELASGLNVRLSQQDLRVPELTEADEVLLTSTSACVLPVVRLNDRPIGTGSPGPMCRKLLARWGELVGIEIAPQAAKFSKRIYPPHAI